MSYYYKAWIPTNNGELSKDKVANSYSPQEWEIKDKNLTLTQIDTDDYADSVFKNKNELAISYKLSIDFEDNYWKFQLSIDVKDYKNLISANGIIEKNGIIKFSFNSNLRGDDSNLANTIFTIVKNCIHGNNHHEQKVDKFIPVQKINCFKYSYIAKRLAEHIKQNEFEAKRILSDNTTNTHRLYVVNALNEQAKGFKSYYDTFCKVFKQEIEKENLQIGYPDSVLSSLVSIKNKLEIESSNNKFSITIFFSILAFFISGNILIKPAGSTIFSPSNHLLFFIVVFTISSLIVIFIDLRYIGTIKAVLSPVFKAKEFYQRIYLYGEAVTKYNKKVPKGKRKYYYLYRLFRFCKYIFGILFLVTLIYGLYNYKDKFQSNLNSNTTKKYNVQIQPKKEKSSTISDTNLSKKILRGV